MKTDVFQDCIQADGTEFLEAIKKTELIREKMKSFPSQKTTPKNDKRRFAVDNDGEYDFNLYQKGDETKKIEYVNANVTFTFRGDQIEVVVYDNPLTIPKHVAIDEELISSDFTFPEMETVFSTRNWEPSEDGVLVPAKDGVCLSTLIESMLRSSKKSIHNFYNLALANTWEYFCTFTFADGEIRLSREMLYAEWKAFLRSLRRRCPDVKALGIYERFEKESSGFHFHFLLGNVDLYLKPARNAKENGEFMYTDFGHQRFNCVDWKNGLNDVVCIRPESTQLQIINYMSKYMTKASPAPYGCKRYLYTKNLNRAFNWIGYLQPKEINDFLLHYNFHEYKKEKKSVRGAHYYTYIMEKKG